MEEIDSDDLNGLSVKAKVFITTLVALREKKRFIIQQGGTWSGKTFNIDFAFIQFLNERRNEFGVTSIVGQTLSQLKRGALRDWNDIIDRLPSGIITYRNDSDRYYKIGNQLIEFFSVGDDKNSAKKIRAGKRDYLFIDECNLLEWEAVDLLIGKTKYSVVLAYNPYAIFWLHEKIISKYTDKDYYFSITTWKDNPRMAPETLLWLKNKKRDDPEGYRILGEGKLGNGRGLVYTNVSYVSKLPNIDWTIGLDPGYTNDPTAIVKVGLYQGELWGAELAYMTGLYEDDDIINELVLNNVTERNVLKLDKDFTLKNVLRRAGFDARLADKGGVEDRVNRAKNYKLNILKTSVNWMKEQKGYTYVMKNDKPTNVINRKTGLDHCWDAFGYACENIINVKLTNKPHNPRRLSVINR